MIFIGIVVVVIVIALILYYVKKQQDKETAIAERPKTQTNPGIHLQNARHFALRRFNIEFSINSDFFIDAELSLALASQPEYAGKIIVILRHIHLPETLNFSYCGPTFSGSLEKSNLPTWQGDAMKVGNCICRKSVDEKMIMWGIEFDNHAYTLAFSTKGKTLENLDKYESCILKIIKSLTTPSFLTISESEKKTLQRYFTSLDDSYVSGSISSDMLNAIKTNSLTKELFTEAEKALPPREVLNLMDDDIVNIVEEVSQIFQRYS